ncbi:Mov34/MPN/PAD-1 family protein [Mesorhizobium sp. M0767]|uniref:Mov34/MPN/PAD-1 family protein n=1 Tax=Mesorhizobium sp. M0767 TaxID=2956995 RepID=UPI003334EA2E
MRDRVRQALRRAGSREIGGILMGQEIARGHFAVVDFSLDEISGERAHFVRDADHHRQALEKFFDRTGHNYQTFNYLGEWHSHPSFSTHPSVTDLHSMQDLVDAERDIEFAVLLIVKIGFFRRFVSSASLHRRGQVPEPVELTTN